MRSPKGTESFNILGKICERVWVDNIKVDLGEMGWMVGTGLNWLIIGTSGGFL
jgi:hypothetical protein